MDENGRDVDPDDAFGALSDPVRVDIVRELAAAFREDRSDPVVGFADLRKRVGVRDSGRFRYHLEELRGRFVEKTEDGYRLDAAGVEVATAIAAGTFTDRAELDPTELDSECPTCGTAAVGAYRDRRIVVTCENDHTLLNWGLPPTAAEDATVPDLAGVATMQIRHRTESTLRGTCPTCCGPIQGHASPGATPRYGAECDRCGTEIRGSLSIALLASPVVVGFLADHGVPVGETYLWEFPIDHVEDPFPGEGTAPFHFRIGFPGETFHAAVDGDGRVVATVRRDAE